MDGRRASKRFGALAVEKGFISKEQFVDAMLVQLENELEGRGPRLIGSVLNEMGYMTSGQVGEVIKAMSKPERWECPYCGVLISTCPKCHAKLKRE
jgi:predicted RNA-binding Zn-ribbon protein involved in translation (DUF1610 family)